MLVMGFGTYDRTVHPRAGILLDGLAARGVDVVEVVAPLGLDTAARVRLLSEPRRLLPLLARLLRRWCTLAVRGRRTARRRRPDAVLVGYLGHFDVILARLVFPRTTLVLDHLVFAADTAADRRAGGAVLRRALGVLDAVALRLADVVVVDTDEHAALVAPARRDRVVVVPVGAGAEWFAAASEQHDPPTTARPLRVVFYGLFTPLQGATTIARALARLDGTVVEALMVGTGQDHAAAVRELDGAAHVRWRDWVDPASLPALVAEHEVCLGIFGDTPKAVRVVPNKAYQGAAAGLAVVTSATDAQRAAFGDAAVYVPPGDAVALAETLRELAADPGRVAALRRSAHTRAVRRFAAEEVVDRLHARLQRPPGRLRGPR